MLEKHQHIDQAAALSSIRILQSSIAIVFGDEGLNSTVSLRYLTIKEGKLLIADPIPLEQLQSHVLDICFNLLSDYDLLKMDLDGKTITREAIIFTVNSIVFCEVSKPK